ncbi:peptidoglycan hydrolase [Halobacillus litoralis]|uniref:glycosyl hydrolase family 18 protein n=1 Tax=Halobacillus litoralis TaxID=45668 RepID=UPI001CD4E0ED|nr:glycosyl hydrolase family 18 protein [Halobacillus litoralis]MCA0969019.1 peptidoglycan hydrolase [Halobacillus litoralis]
MNKKRTFILLISSLILLVAAGFVFILYPFPSNEKITYYENETLIVYQNEVMEDERVQSVNQQHYVPFSFIKENIDSNIVYDKSSESVIITMPQDVYQLPTDELKYYMNQKAYDLHFPVTTPNDGEPSIAAKWLEQVYPVYLHQTEKALFVYENGSTRETAELVSGLDEHQTKVREQPKATSPYYINLGPGDKVYIKGEEERYYHIITSEGIAGYLVKEALGDPVTETLTSETVIKKRKNVSEVEKPFHLTWDAIYHPAATPSVVEAKPGVQILSPTWFEMMDAEGSIENFAKKEYVASAHEQGDQVWALFSNGFDADLTKQVLPSFEKRQYMIRQLLDYARIYDLDGINIDFENVYLEDGPYLTQFVRELTPLAHQAGLVVSVDVAFPYGSEQWSRFLEHEKLAEAADYLMVMAYDEHWANSPEAGSVASLPWVRRNLENLVELVPPEKLLLGIPLYTRLWTETTLENGEVDVSSESFSMEETKEWMSERNIAPVYDEMTKQNVVTYEEGNNRYIIWIEDETSLVNRVNLMKEFNLAGIASWSESFAEPSAWQTIQEAMNP